jgi:hypothetical protein
MVDPLILTPQRPSPSPSSNLAGILSDSQMGTRISPSARIGASLSIITSRKPCRLVRPPRWPHHTALHMAAGPTPDTRPSSPVRTFPQPLLACHSSRCTTSPMYTTTSCHSNRSSSSNNSNNRHRVWKSTTACLIYSVTPSRLRAQC